ncbi:MAG: hypothetical protein WA738_07090 [Candidatus Angelobacter sp.]
MNLNDLLGHVDEKWQKDFLRFIDTGEADDAFLTYLNHDTRGQQAVEMAFNAHAQAIQGLAEELKKPPLADEITIDPAATASKKLVHAVEGVLELAPEQRNMVVKEAASNLLSSAPPSRQQEVEAVAQAFNVAAKI